MEFNSGFKGLIEAQDQYSCIQDALAELPSKQLARECFCYYFQRSKMSQQFLNTNSN